MPHEVRSVLEGFLMLDTLVWLFPSVDGVMLDGGSVLAAIGLLSSINVLVPHEV